MLRADLAALERIKEERRIEELLNSTRGAYLMVSNAHYSGSSSSTAISGTISTPTTVVTASGTTQTLPAASGVVGYDYTVVLTVPGWVDIARAGSDTIEVDGSQTTIRLDNDGATVTLRAISSSAWGLA